MSDVVDRRARAAHLVDDAPQVDAGGKRYLSTPLFENIEEVMTEDERALMKSTPGYQMAQW
ncbi:hypothetical protein AUC68_08840 [Methyloceanibacter methanicus]|uniref:Uncharacterized protein n=1 Tax=Methyloceanibacter methanicus TaxID=1774968 RepID=A0A1E3VYC6_9HYPH|nr:hypothetical protein [Methyloceanibacter methanicus]ODR98519.1 hypothetical protein AUC68_08840 [Methyloceanibacter methanicus]